MRNYILAIALAVLAACTSEKQYKIGVSQCSQDDWRALLNTEIGREARFFGDINVEITSAGDDSRKQIGDIEQFIASGKDLIIVAPNVADDVQPAIEEAMGKGIPVILIDRRTQSDNFTAFIGADNNAIGENIGEYLHTQAKGKPASIVELRGLKGSSPEKERHEGFRRGIGKGDSVIASVYCDWNESNAVKAMDSLLKKHPHIDYVFAQNDRMALGAHKAIKKARRDKEIRIIGVDGLVCKDGGVDMVIDHRLLATHTYPTGGSEAIQTAHKILTGEPFQREMTLPSALVDSTNARVLHLQYLTMMGLDEKYLKLERLTDHQLERINTQQWMLGGAILIVLLLAIGGSITYRLYREKAKVNELMMNQIKTLVFSQHRDNDEHQIHADTQSQDSCAPIGEDIQMEESEADDASAQFLAKVETIITKRLGDSDLYVNDIADELGMSRVQLYRKIKAMSDQNINDFIRKARLKQAMRLLQTTNKSVSEVAYEVGFSTPSYFTRCFKDFYGISPSAANTLNPNNITPERV